MAQELIPEDIKQTIKQTFLETLKEDVVLEVYTQDTKNDKYNEAVVSLVKTLAELSGEAEGVISYDRRRAVREEKCHSLAIGPHRPGCIPYSLYGRPPGGRGPFFPHHHCDGIHGQTASVRTVDPEDR